MSKLSTNKDSEWWKYATKTEPEKQLFFCSTGLATLFGQVSKPDWIDENGVLSLRNDIKTSGTKCWVCGFSCCHRCDLTSYVLCESFVCVYCSTFFITCQYTNKFADEVPLCLMAGRSQSESDKLPFSSFKFHRFQKRTRRPCSASAEPPQ